MESIIGKKYWPVDNSYSVCLNDLGTTYQLAGNHYNQPKQPEETEIISEPYEFWLWPRHSSAPKAYTFINVKCKRGLIHRTLFNVSGFEPRVNDRLTWLYDYNVNKNNNI